MTLFKAYFKKKQTRLRVGSLNRLVLNELIFIIIFLNLIGLDFKPIKSQVDLSARSNLKTLFKHAFSTYKISFHFILVFSITEPFLLVFSRHH
jgi:hypothetical protein